MKGISTEIEVGILLKQYLQKFMKNDFLVLSNGNVIFDLIRPYLVLRSTQLDIFNEESKKADEKDFIKIILPLSAEKYYSKSEKKIISKNPYYRTVVSKKGQIIVKRHLQRIMRMSFRIYMDGYTAAWEEMDKSKIVSGVVSFFSDYDIEWTNKDLNAMRRDWVRYRTKKRDGRINPIL